mmetsp:Transcript_7047/g.20748  ORF Transcript_7047/g.20748 Transcript_7047/m.20748 type:complete len:94 (-) Transcript_7047:4098-4379(-)
MTMEVVESNPETGSMAKYYATKVRDLNDVSVFMLLLLVVGDGGRKGVSCVPEHLGVASESYRVKLCYSALSISMPSDFARPSLDCWSYPVLPS